MSSASLKKIRRLDQVCAKSSGSSVRYRRAALAALTNAGSRASQFILFALCVKLTLPYLAQERFGAWMTIVSFTALLSFLDFGLGSVLTNRVAFAQARSTRDRLADTVTNGLVTVSLLGATIGLVLVCVSAALPLENVFANLDASLQSELRSSLLCFSGLFGLSIVTSSVVRIFYGLQRAHEANLVLLLGNIAASAVLFWASSQRAGLPVLLICTMGVPLLCALALVPRLMSRGLLRATTLKSVALELRTMLRPCGAFLFLQLGTLAATGADTLIMASVLGPAMAGTFAVMQRLFQFASQPFVILNTPLWAAYADAKHSGDTEFLRKTLRRSLLVTLLGVGVISGVLYFAGPAIVERWTDGRIHAENLLFLGLSCWAVLEAVNVAFAMFLNGTDLLKPQVAGFALLLLVGLPLKIAAAINFGMAGMIFTFTAAYAICFSVAYVLYRKAISAALELK